MIPYGRQDIAEADIEAVSQVLRSDFLTTGPKIAEFEEAFSSKCGSKEAVAVSNATAALHAGYLACGLGPGDWLWTVPNTFVATANAAIFCGAKVDFVDTDPATYNMSVERLSEKLVEAKAKNQLPKIVVPVHFSGQSCDMEAIFGLANEYGFKVVEDASHAVGAQFKGEPVGCCKYSHGAVFSFHPVKIVTSGEGGIFTCNDSETARTARLLRSHGTEREKKHLTDAEQGPWYYEQLMLGFNYRLTDIQAALGINQLKRLDQFLVRRRELVRFYQEAFSSVEDLRCQAVLEESLPSWHLFVVELLRHNRKEVFDKLREAGVGVNVHYIPVHLQPFYRKLGFRKGDFPNAEAYYERALSLPLFPAMSDDDQLRVVEAVTRVLELT